MRSEEFNMVKKYSHLSLYGLEVIRPEKIRIQDGKVNLVKELQVYSFIQEAGVNYKLMTIGGLMVSLHRAIYIHAYGEIPEKYEIDHIDRNILNNLPSNLRALTKSQNSQNRATRPDNKSGYRGVSYDKPTGKYRVEIKVDGVQLRLGRFKSLEEAIAVRKEAELKYHPYAGKA